MKNVLYSKLSLAGLLLSVAILPTLAQGGASNSIEDNLTNLPTVAFREDGPQRYVFTCDYLHFDLEGNITGRERVSGDYTRGLPDGKARWNNVRIAQTTNANDAFPGGVLQNYMEGFTYDPSTRDQFKKSFFSGFPDSMQTKSMVWDVTMFELFARKHFDQLKLNEPYEIGPSDISLPGGGNFSNRRPLLTWVGVSKMNGRMCAVIQYEAFYNKLSLQAGGQNLNGRSDYWGTIWVSLADKQIEKGTLNEGVLLGFAMPGQAGQRAITIFRQATLNRRSGEVGH